MDPCIKKKERERQKESSFTNNFTDQRINFLSAQTFSLLVRTNFEPCLMMLWKNSFSWTTAKRLGKNVISTVKQFKWLTETTMYKKYNSSLAEQSQINSDDKQHI